MATAANNARDKAAGQHSFMDMLAEPAPAKKSPASTTVSRTALPSAPGSADSEDFTSAERLIFEKNSSASTSPAIR